jgi:hypothetical protein
LFVQFNFLGDFTVENKRLYLTVAYERFRRNYLKVFPTAKAAEIKDAWVGTGGASGKIPMLSRRKHQHLPIKVLRKPRLL